MGYPPPTVAVVSEGVISRNPTNIFVRYSSSPKNFLFFVVIIIWLTDNSTLELNRSNKRFGPKMCNGMTR